MKSPFVQYTVQRLKRPPSDYPATILRTERGLQVSLGGKPFATYDNTSSNKPIIWQVTGPDGQKMLRDWPLKKDTPGEAHDHIHHQGIFIGHERISGKFLAY